MPAVGLEPDSQHENDFTQEDLARHTQAAQHTAQLNSSEKRLQEQREERERCVVQINQGSLDPPTCFQLIAQRLA